MGRAIFDISKAHRNKYKKTDKYKKDSEEGRAAVTVRLSSERTMMLAKHSPTAEIEAAKARIETAKKLASFASSNTESLHEIARDAIAAAKHAQYARQ